MAPEAAASIRYRLLKDANGKCQLCGIDRLISPMDIDHIVPSNKADKIGRVSKGEHWIDVNSPENLQVLCFRCNRAKRETDDTDFRRTSKLVRDRIPEIIAAKGRVAETTTLRGQKLLDALKDKLVEEHAEFVSAGSIGDSLDELADMIEVILSIGAHLGAKEEILADLVRKKREEREGFSTVESIAEALLFHCPADEALTDYENPDSAPFLARMACIAALETPADTALAEAARAAFLSACQPCDLHVKPNAQ
jgi:predicted house-cleaning noncanonical NTP pyrophosphatase (MazG superfamily)